MVNYIALFRGESVEKGKIIGVSADPSLVTRFALELLASPHYPDNPDDCPDPVLRDLNHGRRRALRRIATEPTNKKTAEAAQ